jgi:hypothetical protein
MGKNAHLSPEALEKKKPLEVMFKPSSRDEKSRGQRLSIWVEELTIADQGWAMMGSEPSNTVVACLNVDQIRAVESPAPFQPLDVVWEQALTEDGQPNTHPGAEGHAGITGLIQGGNGKMDKDRRKLLRSRLADKANISPVPVPHDIPEEHIRLAAFYISVKPEQKTGSQPLDWIKAIRQLRRERVKQAAEQAQSS